AAVIDPARCRHPGPLRTGQRPLRLLMLVSPVARLREAAFVLTAIGLVRAPVASAQRVQLLLRPRVGDTISMRLDQQTEVSGKRDPSKVPASSLAAAQAAVMING